MCIRPFAKILPFSPGVFYADAPPPYPGINGAPPPPPQPAGAAAANGFPNGHYAPVGTQQVRQL